MKIRIALRNSSLSLQQGHEVRDLIRRSNKDVDFSFFFADSRAHLSQDDRRSFTTSVDQMLLSGEADIAVHSLKDVGIESRYPIVSCAIMRRSYPYDVLLFKKNSLKKICMNRPIYVGTSSERRSLFIQNSLPDLLPKIDGKKAHTVPLLLKGNVCTRLAKLFSNRKYDAVILSLCSMERIFDRLNPVLRQMITRREYTLRMIIPLFYAPYAAQGAIVVESLANYKHKNYLRSVLNHRETEWHTNRERNQIKSFNSKCSIPYGYYSLKHKNHDLFFKYDYKKGIRLHDACFTVKRSEFFDTRSVQRVRKNITMPSLKKIHSVFISHYFSGIRSDLVSEKRVWCSGLNTWKKLAEKSIWVEASCDQLGFTEKKDLLYLKLLRFPWRDQWAYITHNSSNFSLSLPHFTKVTGYTMEYVMPFNVKDQMQSVRYIYWSDSAIVLCLLKYLDRDQPFIHLCHLGRTYDLLRSVFSGRIRSIFLYTLEDD